MTNQNNVVNSFDYLRNREKVCFTPATDVYHLWTGDTGRCTHQCHRRHSGRLGSFCQSIAADCAILSLLFNRDLKHRLAELGRFHFVRD
jgi:hypothetical protein